MRLRTVAEPILKAEPRQAPPPPAHPEERIWRWDLEGEPVMPALARRLGDVVTLGAFTTDVLVPLGLLADSAGVAVSRASLGIGAGAYRLVQGGLGVHSGLVQKVGPPIVDGALDVGIGVATMTASLGLGTVPSLLTAVGLLGAKTAFDQADKSLLFPPRSDGPEEERGPGYLSRVVERARELYGEKGKLLDRIPGLQELGREALYQFGLAGDRPPNQRERGHDDHPAHRAALPAEGSEIAPDPVATVPVA